MIGRILAANRTYRNAFDYSERKWNQGLATVCCARNVEDDCAAVLMMTFDRYENNPAIAEKAYRLGFHLAISPDENDVIYGDTQTHVALIDEVMQRMGYGEQPYVVYRHNDIDREHFHVVSVRVNGDGRVIDDFQENRRLLRILKELGPKYGFVLGKSEEKKRAETQAADDAKLRVMDPDKAEKIRRRFERALKYVFKCFSEFRDICAAMGVFVREKTKGGKRTLWFAAERDGEAGSQLFSAESALRMKAHERYDRRLAENTGTEERAGERPLEEVAADLKAQARRTAVTRYAADRARTWNEFAKLCSECRIEAVPHRGKDGRLTGYSAVDTAFHRIGTPGRGAVSVKELREKDWEEGPEVEEALLSPAQREALTAAVRAEYTALAQKEARRIEAERKKAEAQKAAEKKTQEQEQKQEQTPHPGPAPRAGGGRR